jgi:hypothetical protein
MNKKNLELRQLSMDDDNIAKPPTALRCRHIEKHQKEN